jgi:hypothetical protein
MSATLMVSNMTNNIAFESKFSDLKIIDREFSDASSALIREWYQHYGEHFLKSEVAKSSLSQKAIEECPFILSSFCDLCYSYHLQKPGQWTQTAVHDVFLNIMPRKVMADDTFFFQVVPVLSNFLSWM